MYIPNDADQSAIREVLGRGETVVVVEANGESKILAVASYPSACREYYLGQLVQAVFRTEHDLTARLATARARAS